MTLPGHGRHRRVLRADRARHCVRPTRRVRTRRTTVAILRLKAVVVVVVKVIVAIAVVVFVGIVVLDVVVVVVSTLYLLEGRGLIKISIYDSGHKKFTVL